MADATALLAGFNSRAGLHASVLPIGIVHGLGRLAPSGVVPFPSMTRMMAATIGQVAKDGTDGYAVASLIARSGADPGRRLQMMRLARSSSDAGGGLVAFMPDLVLSAMLADRMALFFPGQVAAFCSPAQVLKANLLEAANPTSTN